MPCKVFVKFNIVGIDVCEPVVVVAAMELTEINRHDRPPIKPNFLKLFILILQSMFKHSIDAASIISLYGKI